MKRILITGGAGLIGYYLTRHLLEDSKNELTLVDNFLRGTNDAPFRELISDTRVTFLEADLTDPSVYHNLPTGFSQVYHLAAVNGTRHFYEKPEEILRNDSVMDLQLLDWFVHKNGGGKFLFTSSAETYAGAYQAFGKLPIPTPEKVPLVVADVQNPRWSYAVSKIFGESLLVHMANRHQFPGIIVRPHNVYGIRDVDAHVIPDLLQRIQDRTDPFPIFGAQQTRSFTYAGDAVIALAKIMNAPETDRGPVEIYNVGSSEEVVIRDLAEQLFTVADWRPQTILEEMPPLGSVERRAADVSKIEQTVGWRASTTLGDGLREVFDWHRSRNTTGMS